MTEPDPIELTRGDDLRELIDGDLLELEELGDDLRDPNRLAAGDLLEPDELTRGADLTDEDEELRVGTLSPLLDRDLTDEELIRDDDRIDGDFELDRL